MRKCCRYFESVCAQKPCCSVLPPSLRRRNQPLVTAPSKELYDQIPKESASDNLAHSSGEPLILEITGMDCADCCSKVTRALSRLPSVKPLHLDYLDGLSSLLYDPDIITPEAIARYVARATAFRVKPVSREDTRSSAYLTLPLTFSRIPPSHLLEQLNPRHRLELGGFTEISFPVRGEIARQPREVLADLADYGPQLLPIASLDGMDDRVAQDLRRIALRTLLVSVLSVPVLAWAPLPKRTILHGIASVVLTTLIQVAAFPILSSSVRSIIFLRRPDMSVLVSVSILTAWIFSIISFSFEAAGKPFAEPFFETAALLVTLIYIGRLVQAATRKSASSAIRALQQLQSSDVILVEQVGMSIVEKNLLHYGDIVRLKSDSRIPTDGIVINGSSQVDETSVTGESLPSTKRKGSSVTAGTLNLNGSLDIQITQLIHENYLARITGLVRQAHSSRSKFQDISDRFASVILPVAVGCSVVAFIVWFFVNCYVRDLSPTSSAISGLTYALAVLVVSCPCAIGVAVPLVVAATMRAGIREGVLFRSSEALQMAHNADVIVFDKTGTLSQGVFSVERVELLILGVNKIILPLTSTNDHPISKAVLAYVSSLLPDSRTAIISSRGPEEILSLPGMGVKASLAGYPLLGGSPNFTGTSEHALVQELTSLGLTLFTVSLAGELVAAFGLADVARPESAGLVAELFARGKRVVVLSGDNAGAVTRLTRSIKILDAKDVHASCSPVAKAAFIADLQRHGRRVCFIGDGTNDGPALAQADVSLCVTSGSDVAIAASGALVSGANLRRSVLGALDLAAHAHQHTMAALVWCIGYNVVALLFAGGSFVRVRIEPRWAGLGELVSLIPVIVVAFALDLRWRWRRRV
ncbi:E1-E2 ATPase-domain-containing protein [Mycena sp. CBHHK59/15]|nr:E1-E2 ATPase-domain-containing protein [Mycena sp. CBHHK59/15]